MLCPKADKGASSGLLIFAVLNIRTCLVLCPKADKGASSGLWIVAVLNIRICLLGPKAGVFADQEPQSGCAFSNLFLIKILNQEVASGA